MAKGYGESSPDALNQNSDGSDNPEGRQLNRRVELKIIGIK
jgi:outer membrane protein OmpA-like peptidoglycan-associated protein